MKHTKANLTAADGGSIHYQYWEPKSRPGAVILVAHGMAEHGGRYQRFAEYFVARNYAVVALDHAGHGKSAGVPGYIRRFNEYTGGVSLALGKVQEHFAGLPVVLVGHSMGGLIAVNFLLAAQQTLAGCILSGAALDTEIQPGVLQMLLIRLFSLVAPKLGVLQLDASSVSRDPAEVKAYVEDPLVYTGKVSARLVAELFAAMQAARTGASSISLPLLILHGGDDKLTDPKGSERLYAAVGSADKQLKLYPGLYHEIFNEPEREQVFEDIAVWLVKHVATASLD